MSRSIWKPTVFNPIATISKENLFFKNRASYISKNRIGYRINIYNGQRWYTISVRPERIGHRVGEFAPTRKRPVHKKKKIKKVKKIL